MKPVPILLWILVATLVLSACATPTRRHVEAVDSSSETVKFLYYQQLLDQQVRGVIECDLEEGGLRNCRQLEVEHR